MKYKSDNSSKNYTDINDIFNFVYNFYKEIIFILIISFISGLSLSSYKLRHSIKEVKSEIEIRNPSISIFQPYLLDLKAEKKEFYNKNFIDEYNNDFFHNLLSRKNLIFFLEQSGDLDSFKKSLGKSSNNFSDFFNNNRFGQTKVKDKIIFNKIFLVYPDKFNGLDFLAKYVLFIKNKTIIELKNKLISIIKNNILMHEQALEIAYKINLLDPILKSYNQYNIVVNEPEALFYRGVNVLTQEIINQEKLLKKLETEKFEYNPILDNEVSIYLNSNYNKSNFFIGSFFGFFLSCLIIFFKTLLKKK
jgi:hypothetical protein